MKKLILFIFLYALNVCSQSLTLFDIDTTNFPNMHAKFYSIDENGDQIINLSSEDFKLSENSKESIITNITCPEKLASKSLSVVLSIDMSHSMGDEYKGQVKIELAKLYAEMFINSLPENSECALTCFEDDTYLFSDFTTEKSKILDKLNYITPIGAGTDFNKAFLNYKSGSLRISKNAKNQKIIVFITDGNSDCVNLPAIAKEAIDQECAIFPIFIDDYIPEDYKKLSLITNGFYFKDIKSIEDVKNSYEMVLKIAQDKASFCTIDWISKEYCINEKIDIEFKNIRNGSSYYADYRLPKSKTANLDFTPQSLRLNTPPININISEKVVIKSKNYEFNVSDIIISNQDFDISPKEFSLKPNDSLELTITYNAKDSNIAFCKFSFVNDLCEQNYYAVGGYKNKAPETPTLKLLTPNGDETLIVGGETNITWEGVAPSDTVRIEFSTDNGVTWELIKNNASGLIYTWKNIPKTVSEYCLIRISQYNVTGDYNPENPTPVIIWEKNYGGSGVDVAYSIIEGVDGSLILVGSTNSTDYDISNIKGGHDLWIIKVNPSNGSIIWEETIGSVNSDERGYKVIENYNSELIVFGAKGGNIWILKLNQLDGSIIWEKTIGGSRGSGYCSAIELKDSTIIIAGNTESIDGDITDKVVETSEDAWIVKLNQEDGSIIWSKTYGGSKYDRSNSIIQISNGSLIFGGISNSSNGDVDQNRGDWDNWVMNLSQEDGSIIWSKTFGGARKEHLESIIELKDSTLVFAGSSSSDDGDKSEFKGQTDIWIVKFLYDDGSIIWEKTIGGQYRDLSTSILENSNGDLILLGESTSSRYDILENKGGKDYVVSKLSPQDGSIEWLKTFGGSLPDYPHAIIESNDESLYATGSITSDDGDINEYYGGPHDFWLLKLTEFIKLQSDISDNLFSILSPEVQVNNINIGKEVVEKSKDTVIAAFVSNIGSFPCSVDSIYIQGSDKDYFSLVSGFPRYTIDLYESNYAAFRFTPHRIGIHNAEIVIITQSDTLYRNITGEGVYPQLEIANDIIDFGTVNVGDEKIIEKIAVLKNLSNQNVEITNIIQLGPDFEQFEILEGGESNIIIAAESEHQMKLRFKPLYGGRTLGQIGFEYNSFASPATAKLFGTGIGGKIEIENYSGYPGEEINVKIYLKNIIPEGLTQIANEFSLVLKVNGTILYPYSGIKIDQKDSIFSYEIKGKVTPSDVLIELPMKVGLGNAETCEINVTKIDFYDYNDNLIEYDIELGSSRFTLLGVCYEGGIRLIDPYSVPMNLSIQPNPTSSQISVDFELIELGGAELMIYDIQGNKIYNTQVNSEPGHVNLDLDLSHIPNGMYNVILQTQNIRATKQLMILR